MGEAVAASAAVVVVHLCAAALEASAEEAESVVNVPAAAPQDWWNLD